MINSEYTNNISNVVLRAIYVFIYVSNYSQIKTLHI